MKINLNESEIKRILEMHSKEKKSKFIIKEQSSTKDDLSEMIAQGCVPGGKVVQMTYKPPRDYSIRLESTTNPGNFRYFFTDGSVGQKSITVPFKMTTMTWDVASCRSKIAQKKNQTITADLQAKLDDLKKREGWVEYEELEKNGMSKQGADQGKYGDPKIFDLGGGKSVKLYKKPGAQGITSVGYTKEQTDLIAKYHDKGYKLKDELTADEQDWIFQPINIPGMPKGWGMYQDPTEIANKADATDFEQLSDDQNIDLKTCKDKLESYTDAFRKRKVIKVSTFNQMKATVQACVNQHHPKWGGLRPGYFRDMVETMKGMKKGGPSSYGDDAKWKLQ